MGHSSSIGFQDYNRHPHRPDSGPFFGHSSTNKIFRARKIGTSTNKNGPQNQKSPKSGQHTAHSHFEVKLRKPPEQVGTFHIRRNTDNLDKKHNKCSAQEKTQKTNKGKVKEKKRKEKRRIYWSYSNRKCSEFPRAHILTIFHT